MAADEVEHAADGADHDLAALLQLRLLGADRRAAEHGDGLDALAGAVGAQRLGDLDAQLARRRQHERLDLVVGRVDELDHREAEGGGLAGSGLGLADHVAAGEELGDCLLLDGAWILVADVVKRGENGLGESERVKGRHSSLDPRRRGACGAPPVGSLRPWTRRPSPRTATGRCSCAAPFRLLDQDGERDRPGPRRDDRAVPLRQVAAAAVLRRLAQARALPRPEHARGRARAGLSGALAPR